MRLVSEKKKKKISRSMKPQGDDRRRSLLRIKCRFTLLSRNVRIEVWGMVATFRDGSYTDKLSVVLSEKIWKLMIHSGYSSLWYVGPMFLSKEEKNQINLKMWESFVEVIVCTLLGTYLLNKSSQHSLKKISRTTSRQHPN